MLYVFHVDAGQMTTYDMGLTLQSVNCLRAAIERKTKIPASSLVLLISGGEVLHSDHMVSSYSAGTDSNPIYMFSKPSVKESHLKKSNLKDKDRKISKHSITSTVCGDLSPIVELSSEFRSDLRSLDGKSVAELKAAVESCCLKPPTVQTVIACAALAQQFSDLAHEVARSCEQLVHEQHLQHQGWGAVVANLEDIFNEFCERSRNFKESFKKHRLKKEEYHMQLNTLNEVLQSLARIPILPALQLNAEEHRFSAFDVFEEAEFEAQQISTGSDNKPSQDFGVEIFKLSEEDVFQPKDAASGEGHGQMEGSDEALQFEAQSTSTREDPTLLHWILSKENQETMHDILDYCKKGLLLIDSEPLKEQETELYHILEYANMHGLKQIKGIENRLYLLDQLRSEVKKLERDQHDQAASLIQCRERLTSAYDPSVLPTLVQSHWCQLEKLLKGHQSLVDYRRRIAKSKDELSHILMARLETVLKIENKMSIQDAHAMLSFQCFTRLARYFSIVAQLHKAPEMFIRAVTEVARRRKFSEAYLKWATDLAEKLLTLQEEEVSRRQEFNALFEGHFLRSLFPGIAELPPAFATQPPPVFDERLPKLADEDVEYIFNEFPDFTKDVPSYDMECVVKFFQQRLHASDHQEKHADVQVDIEKDLESETGEFDKVSAHQVETIDTSTLCVPITMAVSTVTEVRTLAVRCEEEFVNSEFYIEESLPTSLAGNYDRFYCTKQSVYVSCVRSKLPTQCQYNDNMDSHKNNIQQLRDYLVKLQMLCKVAIHLMRDEMTTLRSELSAQQKITKDTCMQIVEAWQKNNADVALLFREETQRLTVDHELELSDMKTCLNQKDDVIDSLRQEQQALIKQHQAELCKLEADHQSTRELLEKMREEVQLLESKIEDVEAQKQRDIKEMQEKMHMDYKAEIESLRSRFRLVALTNNMDRSPSESSLEKIERTDVIEIANHNAIVMQTKENADVEKDEAVRVALEKCESEWQQKLTKYEADKQVTINDITRRLLSEKDRQLEQAREREQNLARECSKYRETIQQLTDPETNNCDSILNSQLATLENEKALLQQQVADLKKEIEKRSEEGDKSREDDSDGRASPKKDEIKKQRSHCHTPIGLSAGTLSLSSCLPGHTVLVLWDQAHHNYTVMQEASIMYFVHSDCLPALDLSINVKSEKDRRLYAIALVDSKEYCYAKKSGNRYGMPRGSRFYRVRVRPHKPHIVPSCCDHKHKTDALRASALPFFAENRPIKKWLTYLHSKDMQKLDTSQSISSNTDELNKMAEVATATLINLESPVSTCEAGAGMPQEDQLDSIEAGDQWQVKMQASTSSAMTDMECSVGRCHGAEPLELTVSSVSVVARGAAPPGSELAEEATP